LIAQIAANISFKTEEHTSTSLMHHNVLPRTNVAMQSPPPTMSQLSQLELLVVMAMRDNIDDKVSALQQSLAELIRARYDLTSKCRYLEAWINDLVAALNKHDIDIPPGYAHNLRALHHPVHPIR
jgi:hypothetical protein